jgi:hypothetical protein
MTFTPRSVRSLARSRPTADPAAVSSTTTPARESGGTDSCAVLIAVSAVAVLIRSCAPISSGIVSGSGVTDPDGTTTSSRHEPGAGKNATLSPCLNPRLVSTRAPTSLTTPAPSNPGTRPPGPIDGGAPKAGDPMTPSKSPGWIGAKETRTRTWFGPSGSDEPSSTRSNSDGCPSSWWTILLMRTSNSQATPGVRLSGRASTKFERRRPHVKTCVSQGPQITSARQRLPCHCCLHFGHEVPSRTK